MQGNSQDQPKPKGPRVEIIGDPVRITEQFRKANFGAAFAANERIRESLRLAPLKAIQTARESMLEAAMGSLRAADVPKIDKAKLLRVTQPTIDRKHLELDFPKPLPQVVPSDIEAIAEAVDRQIDATQTQTTAILALHSAMEERADRAEERAERSEEVARRTDIRTAWLVWLTVLLAGYAFVDLFLR